MLPKCTKTKGKLICMYVYIYMYVRFKKFQLTLTQITVHKKWHYSFPLSSKRLLEHRVLLPIAWRTRHFFVRYLALCLLSIAKLNISNIGEERILCLKSLISYFASLYWAYIFKDDNQNTTQNYHCIQHHFSAIRIFGKSTYIKCKPLQAYIIK
jgi:hypothetical protein